MNRSLVPIVLCAFCAVWQAPAFASDLAKTFPSSPIRIIVGFAPGGPTDRVAREVAVKLQESWGSTVMVENRPGAGGRIALEYVSRAKPDGYTLLVTAIQAATNVAVYRKQNYDTLRDFEPVTQLTATVLALAVNPKLPVRTLAELVDWAKQRNQPLTYASSGVASAPHFAGALLQQRTGLVMTHIPFGGAALAQTAIMGGHVDIGFVSAISATALLREGKLRALAVAADRRPPQLNDIPTMAEVGYPGFEVSSWQGVLAPAGTPPDIVLKLQRELAHILSLPDVRSRLQAVAAEPIGSGPAVFRAYIQSEIEKWTAVATQANIEIE